MHLNMAAVAQGDEVPGQVVASSTSVLEMVNFELFASATVLAFPTVALEHLQAQARVVDRLEHHTGLFVVWRAHALSFSSSMSCSC